MTKRVQYATDVRSIRLIKRVKKEQPLFSRDIGSIKHFKDRSRLYALSRAGFVVKRDAGNGRGTYYTMPDWEGEV